MTYVNYKKKTLQIELDPFHQYEDDDIGQRFGLGLFTFFLLFSHLLVKYY